MERFSPASWAANTLDLCEVTTYASTYMETMEVIKFFLEDMKPVKEEDLDPKDSRCHICTDEFTSGSHIAVQLPCNHYFGEPCIQNWLRPYETADAFARKPEFGANTCPMCRQVFFPAQKYSDILPEIEMRIKVWDKAYAHVEIALSEKERQAREDLLLFLQKYRTRGFDEYYPDTSKTPSLYLARAQFDLLGFCYHLKEKNLHWVQEGLVEKLLTLAKPVARGGFRWSQDNDGELCMVEELQDDDGEHDDQQQLERQVNQTE